MKITNQMLQSAEVPAYMLMFSHLLHFSCVPYCTLLLFEDAQGTRTNVLNILSCLDNIGAITWNPVGWVSLFSTRKCIALWS